MSLRLLVALAVLLLSSCANDPNKKAAIDAKRGEGANPRRSAEQYVAAASEQRIASPVAVRIVVEMRRAKSIIHGEITLEGRGSIFALP